MIVTALLLNTVPCQSVYSWSLFSPKTYDECVLEKIKDANNTAAVVAVKQSCRELFPVKRLAVPRSSVEKIAILNVTVAKKGFEIKIKNNNHDWNITDFTLAFSEKIGNAGNVNPHLTEPPIGTVCTVLNIEYNITPYGNFISYIELDNTKAYDLWLVNVNGTK